MAFVFSLLAEQVTKLIVSDIRRNIPVQLKICENPLVPAKLTTR